MGRRRSQRSVVPIGREHYRTYIKTKGLEESTKEHLPFWKTYWTPACVRKSVKRYRDSEEGAEKRRISDRKRWKENPELGKKQTRKRWSDPYRKAKRLRWEAERRARKKAERYYRSVGMLKRNKKR